MASPTRRKTLGPPITVRFPSRLNPVLVRRKLGRREQASAAFEDFKTTVPKVTTITQIKTIGAGGQSLVWTPAQADASGNATWPQTMGNQVPFTSGMWVYAAKALTWTVQGSQCQTVDAQGACH